MLRWTLLQAARSPGAVDAQGLVSACVALWKQWLPSVGADVAGTTGGGHTEAML